MDRLPPELLLKIADQLPVRDLVAFSGINRKTFELLSSDCRLWRKHLNEVKRPDDRCALKWLGRENHQILAVSNMEKNRIHFF